MTAGTDRGPRDSAEIPTLTPQQIRDVEKALERWTELHDDDCECGPCVMLRHREAW